MVGVGRELRATLSARFGDSLAEAIKLDFVSDRAWSFLPQLFCSQRRVTRYQLIDCLLYCYVSGLARASIPCAVADNFGDQANFLAQAIRACECFRSEEHTSELQSLMRISYAVFCLQKNKQNTLT